MSAALRYRPEIDGLRALAVLAVMLFHAGNRAFPGGYVGVDIFFVISGFLITSIISKEVDNKQFSFAHFYERRIRRIFPALYFLLLSVLLAGLVFLTPPELRNLGQSVFATVAFAGNIFFYFKSGYFDPDGETQPLLHMWSLGVEEQFYIFFPVFLLLVSQWGRRWLIPLLATILVASLVASVAKSTSDPAGVFYLPHFRGWELLVGCILALWMRAGFFADGVSKPTSYLLEFFALACIAIPVLGYNADTPFPGLTAIPPVLGTAILIAVSRAHTPVGRLLAWKPMTLIGLISYSAYLWHQPLLVIARLRTGFELATWQANLLCLAALGFAYVSWRYVERPFRDSNFLARRQVFLFAAITSALIAGMGLALHFGKGLPHRFESRALQLAATAELSPKRGACHAEAWNQLTAQSACRYGGADTSWAVLGDSHGVELGYALSQALEPSGKGIVHLTYSACPPLLREKVEGTGCTQWLRSTTDWLADNEEIRNVVIVFRHSQYLLGPIRTPLGGADIFHPPFLRSVPPELAKRAYWEDFAQLVGRIAEDGRRVFVVTTVPELPRNPMDYVYTGRWPFLSSVKASIPMDGVRKRQSEVRQNLQRIVSSTRGTVLIDTNEALCDKQGCAVIADSEVLYFDDNHLSLPGAARVVESQLGPYLPSGISR